MITRFEDHTAPLTVSVRENVLPVVAALLGARKGKASIVTNAQLRSMLQSQMGPSGAIADATLRAVIHTIRISGIVPDLVASGRGYYVAETEDDLHEYAKSLDERARSIQAVRSSLYQHSRLVRHQAAGQGDQLALFHNT